MEKINSLGSSTTEHYLPFESIPQKSTVVILTELGKPALSSITAAQWKGLQTLINLECRVIWVTSGAFMDVINPDRAMVLGLARTLRNENPEQTLITLDVDRESCIGSAEAILHIVAQLNSSSSPTLAETEFVERQGVLHISRLRPDDRLNDIEQSLSPGRESSLESLHDHSSCVRLVSDRAGTLDSLHYAEVSTEEIPLQHDFAEIQIHAASMNFKVC